LLKTEKIGYQPTTEIRFFLSDLCYQIHRYFDFLEQSLVTSKQTQDLTKTVFQVHGVDGEGEVAIRKLIRARPRYSALYEACRSTALRAEPAQDNHGAIILANGQSSA
jgi:hypothetical protein